MTVQVPTRNTETVNHADLNQYSFRPATLDDLPAAVEVAGACDRLFLGVSNQNKSNHRSTWTSPHGDLATDSLLAHDANGALAAFAHVSTRPPFHEVRMIVKVTPAHRSRELGDHLFKWAHQQAARVAARAEPGVRSVAVMGMLEQDAWQHSLGRSIGMEPTRVFVRFITDLDRAIPEPVWPDGVALRPCYLETHARAICLADEDAFRDHWGHVERTEDEAFELFQRFLTSDPDLDPELFFVAWDGDEIAGMSLCFPKTDDDPSIGYVGVLCVRRPWRGKGLGAALLHHSFRNFRGRGCRKVALHADAENLTGALRLYQRVGMSIDRHADHFEVELRPGVDPRVIRLEGVRS